ncbi:TIGR00730 family Rossman fold protein [Streptomyces sp. NPDC048611]|uniref:LOG family protein n=1 Tax=Streptomyces sp. NPDC048611 TaxID=3155635 RepID=UPI003444D063
MSADPDEISVCVFCSSAEGIAPQHIELAELTGTRIAERGWTLVSGGESVSMMGAVARGARALRGTTVGIVPESLLHRADHEAAELLVTETMAHRKAAMVKRADVLLALPGGVGTCEEIFESWTAWTLGAHTKPLVLLDPGGHFAELLAWVDSATRRGFISARARRFLTAAASVDEALAECAAGTAWNTAGKEPV